MGRSVRLLDNNSGIVEVTSRVVQGRFLTRPSAVVNELILGIIGRGQALYGVELYAFVFMSNHFHMLMRADSAKQMADFLRFVKTNIAKEIGKVYDWKETFWGPRYHSAPLDDRDEEEFERIQAMRLRYILSNGCKELLVASPLEWPGVSTAGALYRGETTLRGVWYDRTAEYNARRGAERQVFPAVQTVRLSPLPFLAKLTSAQRRELIVEMIRSIEEETRKLHEKAGSRPVGARAILRQHPHDAPESFRSSPGPWFHCASRERYREMRDARAITIAAYREAAERLRCGERDAEFPEGTFPPPAPFVVNRAPPPP